MKGDRIPSLVSAPVSPKAKASSSPASRPDISGNLEPQKVSDDAIFQGKERYAKTEPELNENGRDLLQSQFVQTENRPESHSTSGEAKKQSIQFNDAVGRKFEFPFQFCNTWLVGNLVSDSSNIRAEPWFSSTRVWKN